MRFGREARIAGTTPKMATEGALANLLGRVRDGSARHATTVLALFGTSQGAARRIEADLGEQRAVRTDLAAVDLTRFPPGLIAALDQMQRSGTTVDAASGATTALWLAPPTATHATPADGTDAEAEPLPMRIAVLSEL